MKSTSQTRRDKQSRWQLKLLLATVATAMALVCSELGLRLFWHNPYGSELPDLMLKIRMEHALTDHLLNRSLVDSSDEVVRYRTDSRCFIQPGRQFDDPEATIAFFGGSTTACQAVKEDLRFAALVPQLLKKEGWRVNTLNAARPGNTLHDAINILFNHVVDDRPDIAVLMHATNDVGVLAADGNYHSRRPRHVTVFDLAKWSLQKASGYSYLAAALRKSQLSKPFRPRDPRIRDWRNDPERAASIPHEAFHRRLRAFVHLCQDFSIRPVLMTQPLVNSTSDLAPRWSDIGAQDRFNELIRQVGREERVQVIDIVRELQETVPDWNKPMKVFYDGMHVTDDGSRIYADIIARNLLDYK